jgi:hypothetical protein
LPCKPPDRTMGLRPMKRSCPTARKPAVPTYALRRLETLECRTVRPNFLIVANAFRFL